MAKQSTTPRKNQSVKTTSARLASLGKLFIFGTMLVLVIACSVMASILGAQAYSNSVNASRLSYIYEIYDSLQLDDSYRNIQADVFGDKRVYEWDKGRTYSSEIIYGHNSTPEATRVELRAKVEAAGFTFIQTEYEGSIQPIDEFKNSKGNYVRVGVMSRAVRDSFTFGEPTIDEPLVDRSNEAPSYVSVKVNLDDNNE